ncbi:MAG TPA: hypothetical protein VMG74_12380 [Gaiellaceae bacterium]|nr:hypothetical protein [Gaiellaceae bacterium]HUJ56667.1 hypothetical protein [Gaiellaceae bacterium]
MRKIAALAVLALTLLVAGAANAAAYWQPSGSVGNGLQLLSGAHHHGGSFADGH